MKVKKQIRKLKRTVKQLRSDVASLDNKVSEVPALKAVGDGS